MYYGNAKIKVLLVDDDENLARTLIPVLEQSGMQVVTKFAGSALFATIVTEQPDILLMDVFLGDSDGCDLCRHLKLSMAIADFPVFLYSAADISSASIALSGADVFLRKPFHTDQLVSLIRESVAEKRK